jgi:ABC-type Fe3+-hydroxamate transport system substrate-binding protein
LDGALQAGKAAGVQEQADEVVTGLRERLASFRATVDGLERRRVFALEWGDPPFNGGTGYRRCCRSPGPNPSSPVRAPRRCG